MFGFEASGLAIGCFDGTFVGFIVRAMGFSVGRAAPASRELAPVSAVSVGSEIPLHMCDPQHAVPGGHAGSPGLHVIALLQTVSSVALDDEQ